MKHHEHPITGIHTLGDLIDLFDADSGTWVNRWIHASFDDNEKIWIGPYWTDHGDPYFDVGYLEDVPPLKRLAAFFTRHPSCELIDWSPGRLLCIQAHGTAPDQFKAIVLEVVEALHGPVGHAFKASFKEMKAAG